MPSNNSRRRPSNRPAAGAASSATSSATTVSGGRPVSGAKRALQDEAREKKTCHIIVLLISFLSASIVFSIMLLGFQKGLPVAERCNCSWTKVIAFTVGAFLTVFLQQIGYLIYWRKCKDMVSITNRAVRNRFDNSKFAVIVMSALGTALFCSAVSFLLVSLFADQNGNVFWIFQSGLGILAVCVTFVLSLACGIVEKFAFTITVTS